MSVNLKIIAVKTISTHLGEYVASLYGKFYANKTDEQILISLEELLLEYLGTTSAKQITSDIKEKIK
ncbi:MAG: hypothetical protein WCV80_00580 [Candidatus Paceibacterota bacterium]